MPRESTELRHVRVVSFLTLRPSRQIFRSEECKIKCWLCERRGGTRVSNITLKPRGCSNGVTIHVQRHHAEELDALATMADGTRCEEGSEFAELLKRKEFWLHSHNRTNKAFAFYDLRAEDPETSERLSVETRQPPFPLPSQSKTTPLKGTA